MIKAARPRSPLTPSSAAQTNEARPRKRTRRSLDTDSPEEKCRKEAMRVANRMQKRASRARQKRFQRHAPYEVTSPSASEDGDHGMATCKMSISRSGCLTSVRNPSQLWSDCDEECKSNVRPFDPGVQDWLRRDILANQATGPRQSTAEQTGMSSSRYFSAPSIYTSDQIDERFHVTSPSQASQCSQDGMPNVKVEDRCCLDHWNRSLCPPFSHSTLVLPAIESYHGPLPPETRSNGTRHTSQSDWQYHHPQTDRPVLPPLSSVLQRIRTEREQHPCHLSMPVMSSSLSIDRGFCRHTPACSTTKEVATQT